MNAIDCCRTCKRRGVAADTESWSDDEDAQKAYYAWLLSIFCSFICICITVYVTSFIIDLRSLIYATPEKIQLKTEHKRGKGDLGLPLVSRLLISFHRPSPVWQAISPSPSSCNMKFLCSVTLLLASIISSGKLYTHHLHILIIAITVISNILCRIDHFRHIPQSSLCVGNMPW